MQSKSEILALVVFDHLAKVNPIPVRLDGNEYGS